MAAEKDQAPSLLERVEAPELPKEAAQKIANLEQQFIRAEVEQLRQSVALLRPLYEKRSEVLADPAVQENFWVRVLSNAPAEIDEYVLPTDAAALGALKNLNIERFEVNEKGEGEPRSIRLTFEFEENPFFENDKLVKEFYWRKKITKTASGKKMFWEGLVSEPVRINWKKDMDLTKGLLDAACDLAEAEKKQPGDRTVLPEFEKLVTKVAEAEAAGVEEDEDEDEDFDSMKGTSFFALFGYRGNDVTAEQSKEATKEDDERYAKILKGEPLEDEDEDEDEEEDDEEEDDFEHIEIFPDGEDLAIALAEDLWPNALKYYVQSFELGEDMGEFDEDELEELEEDEDDEEEESHPRKKTKKI